ncbi:MAG: hypothetical protein KY476_27040, partial [Planctomycetes bacterium]|nr:hypothetical protein [Planctomycetota bacterium]
ASHFDPEGLAPPPRDVPLEVERRLRLSAVTWPLGVAVGAGVIFAIIGVAILAAGPAFNALGLIPLVLGLGLVALLLWAVHRRAAATVALLRDGRIVAGRIESIRDRESGGWLPYARAIEKWSGFQKETEHTFGGGAKALRSMIASQLRHWPCRVKLLDHADGDREIETKLDLSDRLPNLVRDPDVVLLDDGGGAGEALAVGEVYPWLAISPNGGWTVAEQSAAGELGRSFLRSFGPVAATYAAAAVGMVWGVQNPFAGAAAQIPPALGVFVVLLFTLTHAVVPVFFYRPFFAALPHLTAHQAGAGKAFGHGVSAFIYFHMGFWYGMPMLALAAMTGWISLAVAAAHVALARRGTRHWVFLEYGSTSLALLLFLVCFSGQHLFPWGIAVIVFQSLLLTVMDWKGRKLWIPTEAKE